MELHYMKVFKTVAELRSFTKASEQLHISQPALSIQIKKLETELNLKLFNKIHNKISLTQNGEILYEYAQKIFALIDEAENKLLNEREFISGVLNIGGSNTPGTYILPEIIGEFKNKYPYVNINLQISNTSEIWHFVNNGTLDFAINGGNMIFNENICTQKLLDDELVIVASPKNKFCGKTYLDTEDIKELSFIVHQTDSQLYTYYTHFVEELGIPKKTSMSLGFIDAIKRAVYANLGVSLMPKAAVALELKIGQLKQLKIKDKKWFYPYSLIYNKNKFLSVAADKFIDMIKEKIMENQY